MRKTCSLNFSTGEAQHSSWHIQNSKSLASYNDTPPISHKILFIKKKNFSSSVSDQYCTEACKQHWITQCNPSITSQEKSCQRSPPHLVPQQPAHVPSGEPGGSLVIAGRWVPHCRVYIALRGLYCAVLSIMWGLSPSRISKG